MKKWIIALMAISSAAIAHDEGHGPKLTETPKQGGVVAPVIKASDAKLGEKAALIHKAELVRSEDGTVAVYVYDSKMNPLPLTSFGKKAKGTLEFKKSKKWNKVPFELSLEGHTFKGKLPTPGRKPFNIDVILNDGNEALLVAFDNLD